jgi:hypothetical protein
MSFFSATSATSLVVKTDSGRVQSVRIRNRSSSAVYAFLHDATVAPGDGTVAPLVPPILVAATSDDGFGVEYFGDGIRFTKGLVIVVSTTDGTTQTTASTASNHDISGVYV